MSLSLFVGCLLTFDLVHIFAVWHLFASHSWNEVTIWYNNSNSGHECHIMQQVLIIFFMSNWMFVCTRRFSTWKYTIQPLPSHDYLMCSIYVLSIWIAMLIVWIRTFSCEKIQIDWHIFHRIFMFLFSYEWCLMVDKAKKSFLYKPIWGSIFSTSHFLKNSESFWKYSDFSPHTWADNYFRRNMKESEENSNPSRLGTPTNKNICIEF